MSTRLELVEHDLAPPVWAALRTQAQEAANAEPTLASLLNAVVLSHDSLGEALLKHGQKEQALQEYRESLQLDPTNANAVKQIAELTKTK